MLAALLPACDRSADVAMGGANEATARAAVMFLLRLPAQVQPRPVFPIAVAHRDDTLLDFCVRQTPTWDAGMVAYANAECFGPYPPSRLKNMGEAMARQIVFCSRTELADPLHVLVHYSSSGGVEVSYPRLGLARSGRLIQYLPCTCLFATARYLRLG